MNTFLPKGKPLNIFFKAWVAFARYHPSIPVGSIIQYATFSKIAPEIIAAYNAPYPSKAYKDGAKSFPSLVPSKPNSPGVEHMKRARAVLGEWQKPPLFYFLIKIKL